QLFHEIGFRMEATGSIEQNNIGSFFNGGLNAVERGTCGVASHALVDESATGAVGPYLQLINCGGAKGITCNQHDLLALGLEFGSELSDGCRFADAVHTDNKNDCRFGGATFESFLFGAYYV